MGLLRIATRAVAATMLASAVGACASAQEGHHRHHLAATVAPTAPGYSATQQQFVSDMRGQYSFGADVTSDLLVSYGQEICGDRRNGDSQAFATAFTGTYFNNTAASDRQQMVRLAETDLCPTYVPAPPRPRVTFLFWGSAPGVSITYGSDSSNLSGPGLPFRAHLAYDSSASYYVASAQLSGYGKVHCEVIVSDGTSSYVKKGFASGGYNICSAQLNNEESFGSGWQ